MTVVSIFASVLIVWALLTRYSGSELARRIGSFAPPVTLVRACTIGIVPLYGAQLGLLVLQSRFENVAREYAWMKTLPVPVFDDRADSLPLHAVFDALGLAVASLESFALAVVVLAVRRDATSLTVRTATLLGCLLAVLSLGAPVMATTDPYEYLATGLIGFQSYALHGGEFVHTAYATYARHVPVNRVVYGPLWMSIDIVLAKLGSSIYAKVELLRFFNVCLVAGFVWLLARADVPRAAVVAAILNPALWFYAVANPHADIEGLVLLAGTYLYARRSNLVVAGLFLVAAGLIKLPFTVIGGALLVPCHATKRRTSAWILAIGMVFSVSYFMPGHAYIGNMSRVVVTGANVNWSLDWLIIAPVVVGASAVLLALRYGIFGAAWLFHQMAPLAAPWYLLWGIPYALASGSIESYLVTFPLAATQAERLSDLSAAILIVTILGLTYDIVWSRHHPGGNRAIAAVRT